MKTILVCGDLVWDTHIARLTGSAKTYSHPHVESQPNKRHGGAWYLAHVIKQAIDEAKAEADAQVKAQPADKNQPPQANPAPGAIPPAEEWAKAVTEGVGYTLISPEKVGKEDERGQPQDQDLSGVAKGFSVWEWFEGTEKQAKLKLSKTENGKLETSWSKEAAIPGAWRIKEFLGCQEAKWQEVCVKLDEKNIPDLLVIDDLRLGFTNEDKCWPSCISKPEKSPPAELDKFPRQVLIKGTPPFDGKLWDILLDSKHADRVTVVLSATALRDVGAKLSTGFSWDKTITEVKAEFRPGGVCWPLRECSRVVVLFGHSGAAVFSRDGRPTGWEGDKGKSKLMLDDTAVLRFERFVYDPENLEGTWSADISGKTFGASSVMVAALACGTLMKIMPSTHVVVSRGLEATRRLHLLGAGHNPDQINVNAADKKIFAINAAKLPETVFRSAFPRELLDEPQLLKKGELPPLLEEQTLLTDVVGIDRDFMLVAAQDIVRFGKDRPLRSVPRMQCGNYFTVDREEIERLNTVRNLILDYRGNPNDKRPLSIAIFGQPGSGKSFAIKELADTLFGKDSAVLEFNLTQFEDVEALHEAFHEVRDKSVQGKMPLVFWDEFDCRVGDGDFGWLKDFLAPMQDAKFTSKGKDHPFGKCIFIFAGGTSHSYSEFVRDESYQENHRIKIRNKTERKIEEARDEMNASLKNANIPKDTVNEYRRSMEKQLQEKIAKIEKERDEKLKEFDDVLPKKDDAFKKVKGPDFVSRLRGYLNIKGPNPVVEKGDDVHVIRRALLLRNLIERHHKKIINPKTKEIPVSAVVLDAFLNVKEYLHGARSLEAVVSLSRLQNSRLFGPSELPPRELLEVHTSSDFVKRVEDRQRYHLTLEDIEYLAEKKQENWKRETGFKYGEVRDEVAKTHPLAKDYHDLDEQGKEGNRLPARLTLLRIKALGYETVPVEEAGSDAAKGLSEAELKTLAISEHRRWMRLKFLDGYAYGEFKQDQLYLHRDLCKFALLTGSEQRLDRAMVSVIMDFLKRKGLALVKQKIQKPKKSSG